MREFRLFIITLAYGYYNRVGFICILLKNPIEDIPFSVRDRHWLYTICPDREW